MFTPHSSSRAKLPRFSCTDKGLETALNTLAQAIDDIRIPNVSFTDGTTEWNGDDVRFNLENRKVVAETECPFGTLITWLDGTTKTGITGGVVYAGEQVWNVLKHALDVDVDTDGDFCVWLEVGVTAYVEDGVLLPGIESSTEPEWKVDADYADAVMPTVDTPAGKATLAIGTVSVKDKEATFTPTGCGGFTVYHCTGTLSHVRT